MVSPTVLTPIRSRLALPPIIAAALLAACFTALCGISRSPLAGTFGGLAIVTLTLPPLVASAARPLDAILVIFSSLLGVLSAWLFLPIAWQQLEACGLVLAAFTFALGGCTFAIGKLGIHSAAAAAIVLVIAFAWLSWPIWLSPWLAGHQSLVDTLVQAHPLLTINGMLSDEGIWTERPRMYGWTALNQDVTYSIPNSVFWCVCLHCGIGLVSMAAPSLAKYLIRINAHQPGGVSHE